MDYYFFLGLAQPPSGGCVLKPPYIQELTELRHPAAFGRLCVETEAINWLRWISNQPPSGGCVLKLLLLYHRAEFYLPAAFGRLCVETFMSVHFLTSTEPAAFGRLCVETRRFALRSRLLVPSRLRAAVC